MIICLVISSMHATVCGRAGGKVGGSIDMMVGGRVGGSIGRNVGGSVGGEIFWGDGWKVGERVDRILSGKSVDSDRFDWGRVGELVRICVGGLLRGLVGGFSGILLGR